MQRAKSIMFTNDELRTLVWAVNNEYHKTFMRNLKKGVPGKSETTDRLIEISRKAYGELTRRYH